MVTNPNISRPSAHPQGSLWCGLVECELLQGSLQSAHTRVMNAGETMYGMASVTFGGELRAERRSVQSERGGSAFSAFDLATKSIDLVAHPLPGARSPFEGHS